MTKLNADELQELLQHGLTIVRLQTNEWEAIENTKHHGTQFSKAFPHAIARSGKRHSVAVIAKLGEEHELRIGRIRSVLPTSTFETRVLFDLIQPISPSSLDAVLAQITEPALRPSAARVSGSDMLFEPVGPMLALRLIEFIASIPENTEALSRILSRIQLPKQFRNARALQVDAIGLALRAFGEVDGAVAIELRADTELSGIHLREDAVVEHDARWIPGWKLADSDLTGRAVFKRGDERLEIITANKQPLEELFGVDLIYLSQNRRALVMVQYKMMEPAGKKRHRVQTAGGEFYDTEDPEWTVPIDKQFQDELARMDRFDFDLSPDGPFRLSSGAFYFKLVKRNASTKSRGIVVSRGHLEHMVNDGQAFGPKGGLRISYRTLDGHYLRGDAFVELLRSGYIGTRGATTDHLLNLIDPALKGGRAVVAAIQSRMKSSLA